MKKLLAQHVVGMSICFFILPGFISCRQQYFPRLNSSDQSILVVEGNIDPGDDSTFIRLTRTVNLNDTAKIKIENNAQVIVEGRDNTNYTLIKKGNGYYVYPSLHLIIGNEYRLRIKTISGEEYLSAYVQAKRSPDIDSVTWGLDTVGLHVYVHTNDPGRATTYYRWDCVEAWMIRMPYYAEVIYNNGIIRPALWPQDNMWECFTYDSTGSLILANSEKLSNDVISYKEIRTIPYHDARVNWQYGILAKQYAIDKQAYDFFTLMKENTENIGGLFSPQPFELKGNIRSVKDTSQYALGYITCSTISKGKKTITGPELLYWRPQLVGICQDSLIRIKNTLADFRFYFDQLGYMPIAPTYDFITGALTGYTASKPPCIDCRVLKNTIPVKPYFW